MGKPCGPPETSGRLDIGNQWSTGNSDPIETSGPRNQWSNLENQWSNLEKTAGSTWKQLPSLGSTGIDIGNQAKLGNQ
ncbi:hypothetical protein AVEN_260434-1 [Araneus ventricosus]|uniref:Uncharacterized protein n=1 Tax=Araneus ventricosus TaxID=182803 RepID=A0A4Y2SP69_ARAVE|nr:hypothetical protein AVEN_260434-1 [Araneus ventricosus]